MAAERFGFGILPDDDTTGGIPAPTTAPVAAAVSPATPPSPILSLLRHWDVSGKIVAEMLVLLFLCNAPQQPVLGGKSLRSLPAPSQGRDRLVPSQRLWVHTRLGLDDVGKGFSTRPTRCHTDSAAGHCTPSSQAPYLLGGQG